MNTSQKAAVLLGLFLFLIVVGSASGEREPTVITHETIIPKDQVTPSNEQSEVVVVSGLFMRSFGDPPTGEGGGARIVYTLTTSTGKEWVLVFDEDRYWPADGVRGYHRKQVVVTGSLIPNGRLLVQLLELPRED